MTTSLPPSSACFSSDLAFNLFAAPLGGNPSAEAIVLVKLRRLLLACIVMAAEAVRERRDGAGLVVAVVAGTTGAVSTSSDCC